MLRKAAGHYGIGTTCTDYRELLDRHELDGAVVAVWHAAHFEVARAVLERGLHLLLEKPMVLRATHARELIRLAERRERQIIMSYPWQFIDMSLRARDVVAGGTLGPIHYVSNTFSSEPLYLYRGDDRAGDPEMAAAYPVVGPGDVYSDPERSGGGQGHLQITHSAALMFFLTGGRAAQVTAMMNHLDVTVDVADAIAVRMEDGCLATVGSTGGVTHAEGKLDLQLYGSEGWIDLDYIEGTGDDLPRRRHGRGAGLRPVRVRRAARLRLPRRRRLLPRPPAVGQPGRRHPGARPQPLARHLGLALGGAAGRRLPLRRARRPPGQHRLALRRQPRRKPVKIASIEAFPLEYPEPHYKGILRYITLAKVTADDGTAGWGECISQFPESALATATIIERGYAPLLVGADPLDVEAHWRTMTDRTWWYGPEGIAAFGLSAVDMALWDLKGKALGLPVSRLLGSQLHDEVPAMASIIFDMEDTAWTDDEFRWMRDQGYRIVKGGWGMRPEAVFGQDRAADLALVERIRTIIGDELELVVDTPGARDLWDVPDRHSAVSRPGAVPAEVDRAAAPALRPCRPRPPAGGGAAPRSAPARTSGTARATGA